MKKNDPVYPKILIILILTIDATYNRVKFLIFTKPHQPVLRKWMEKARFGNLACDKVCCYGVITL